MPRLGSESNSSVRRHNPTQTLSNYFQVNSQVWNIRTGSTTSSDAQTHADPSSSQLEASPDPELDALDDLLNRTRASSSRTRWNARSFGSPYGQRPLHKWLPSEQKHFEELSALMEMFPEPGSDDEYEEEKDLHELVLEELDGEEAEADEDDRVQEEEEEEGESDEEEADIDNPASSQPQAQPHSSSSASAAAMKKRERNKKKKAKARAKAKEKMKPPPAPSDPARDPPQDLLMSMSRIAKLVGTLNAESPDESNELLQRVRDAFTEEGRRQLGSAQNPTEPAQWRAEVLQSVRRMESMLGQMEKWQAQVAPGEIEALRAETARLEVRVRAVVEQKERERAGARTAVPAKQSGSVIEDGPVKLKEAAEVEVEVAEAAVSSEGEGSVGLDDGEVFPPGADAQEDDSDSVSDSVLESTSCPSETDTGATELEPDEPSLQEDKRPEAHPPPPAQKSSHAIPPPAATPSANPSLLTPESVRAPNQPPSIPRAPTSATSAVPPPSTTPIFEASATALHRTFLSTPNQNIPPEPPTDPVEHLKKNPWSMIEVLFLLEVVAHFPPAEHGWTFVAEAYNNILITRPLQEWFGKQAATSNEEEAKMKTLLQRMGVEKRQIAARRASAKAGNAAHGEQQQGQPGKPAPFGSAEARAEANDRARLSTAANMALDEDTIFLTRLPHPIVAPGKGLHPADNPANSPPMQRVVPFPRRRPPFNLASSEARAFARVMASAAAGVRPPSGESRSAMLALYSATKSRFPVRTAWDCWHRWCTPWIAQEGDTPAAEPDKPPVVLDYIAGNLCLPAGTWITQSRGFVYRPIPGTYPDVPGVQRKMVGGFDPRPGMVAYARMVHLNAEKTWSGMGLKRKIDGTVAEEVLVGRRAKLPGTLLGIWPAKAQPPKAGANARPGAHPAAAQPAQTPAAQARQPAKPQPTVPSAQAGQLPASPKQTSPPAAASSQHAATATPATKGEQAKAVRFAPLPPPPAPATSTASPSKPQAVSASTPAMSASLPSANPANPSSSKPTQPVTTRPSPLPLPTPRAPLAREPPNVPEGTLGNTQRRGMVAWFESGVFRPPVLERVLRLKEKRRVWEASVASLRGSKDNKDPTDLGVDDEDADEEERGTRVPLHLKNLAIPPVPPLRAQLWAGPPLDRPRRELRSRSVTSE
ncbi:hypothetical protein FKP32DRAFT_1679829 [Trametes sanguinea]|nr:hypothetical protein FKP32DRAFT_1679829 [Trametes sanguinea]